MVRTTTIRRCPGIAGGLASLNPDATEEFRVITNNFMPEYGRNNGAIIDVVTKSGSNDWHGGARWFGRYNALGARDYFNHNIDPDTGTMEAQNPYVRNQFGFNFGGPIVRNKTFFFVDADWQRFRTTLTNRSAVPNAAFKSMLNGRDIRLHRLRSQRLCARSGALHAAHLAPVAPTAPLVMGFRSDHPADPEPVPRPERAGHRPVAR